MSESSAGTVGSPGFGTRLRATMERYGRLCIGIDPHPWLLERWELDDSAAGAREFGLRVLNAIAGTLGIVKPQVAFFERYGSAGYQALERVLAEARGIGVQTIIDAKRGDIGSTMDAYASAWLTPGSALEGDALTVSPYLGLGALSGTAKLARSTGKGLFVLAATSNPEAAGLQQAWRADVEQSVAASIVSGVAEWNVPDEAMGSFGVVIGATLRLEQFGVALDAAASPTLPVLAPGFGEQGAHPSEIAERYGALAPGVIVTESRSLLEFGRDGLRQAAERRRDDIAAHYAESA